jgi:hypothetical protein
LIKSGYKPGIVSSRSSSLNSSSLNSSSAVAAALTAAAAVSLCYVTPDPIHFIYLYQEVLRDHEKKGKSRL